MYYTYVLHCVDTNRNRQRFYIGLTTNLDIRKLKHKTKSIKTTKSFDHIELVYYEVCLNKKDARKRELRLKTGFGRGYIKRRIENYLKSKRFDDFASEEIINHFFEKSVIIKENDGAETFARFRFSCFLQYFLTKKMEVDPNFKDYVLQENVFLKFCDEIDYYTGLKRDEYEILKLLIERMNDEYKDLLNIILEA